MVHCALLFQSCVRNNKSSLFIGLLTSKSIKKLPFDDTVYCEQQEPVTKLDLLPVVFCTDARARGGKTMKLGVIKVLVPSSVTGTLESKDRDSSRSPSTAC